MDENDYHNFDSNQTKKWFICRVVQPALHDPRIQLNFSLLQNHFNTISKFIVEQTDITVSHFMTIDDQIRTDNIVQFISCLPKLKDNFEVPTEIRSRVKTRRNSLSNLGSTQGHPQNQKQTDFTHLNILITQLIHNLLKKSLLNLKYLKDHRAVGTLVTKARSLKQIGNGGYGVCFQIFSSEDSYMNTTFAAKASRVELKRNGDGSLHEGSRRQIQKYTREIELNYKQKDEFNKAKEFLNTSQENTEQNRIAEFTLNLLYRTQLINSSVHLMMVSELNLTIVQELEYMNGGNLEQYKHKRFDSGHRLSKNEICFTIHDMLMGLYFLHRRNIIHRDISTNNVLVQFKVSDQTVTDPQTGANHIVKVQEICRVVLCDFDNSRFFDGKTVRGDTYEQALTKAISLGKPHYRPPEGVYLPRNYDQKWDVFQLGMVIWEIFCDKNHPYTITQAITRDLLSSDPSQRLKTMFELHVQHLGIPTDHEFVEIRKYVPDGVIVPEREIHNHTALIEKFMNAIRGMLKSSNLSSEEGALKSWETRKRLISHRIETVSQTNEFYQYLLNATSGTGMSSETDDGITNDCVLRLSLRS